MPVSLYLAPQIGTGTYLDPYRSLLNNIINIPAGEWFDEIDHPVRRLSVCCVHASDSTHATIVANPQVIPLSSVALDDLTFSAQMDSKAGVSSANITGLESKGLNMAWMSIGTTTRDLISMILRGCQFAQRAEGDNVGALKELILANLDNTVGTFTVTRRNVIKNWMSSKGLATGWITNSSTVRQIIHFIMMNMNWPKIKLSKESF